MVFRKNTLDILHKKQAQLANYTTQFDNAVALVTSTINSLDEINAGITETIREIEDYQQELETTRAGLNDAKAKNSKVIANFRALLCVD